MTRPTRECAFFWCLLIFAILSSGCSRAQSYLSPGYIMGEIRDGLGLVKPEPAPDFVVRGRPDPAEIQYVPLKPPPRGFHSEASSPSSKLAAESAAIADLEASRSRNKSRAATTGAVAKASVPPEEGPPPMKWNPWDTE